MGFMDSIFGGGETTSTTQSGYQTLPDEIQNAFSGYGSAITNNLVSTSGELLNTDMFVPLGITPDEQKAMEMYRTGFTPTPESLNADLAMLMNPYNQYVIDEINRQSQGDYSIFKQALNESGQMGSNRSILGANDIDLTRTNQIGMFMQDQYNTALNTALGTLTNLKMADAQALMGLGEFERALDMQTQQAPVNQMMTIGHMLGALPSDGGTISEQTSQDSGLGGIGSLLSGVSSLVAPTVMPAGATLGPSVFDSIFG